ncbi:caspase domain-containing protein [Marimonas sp. MJW-29]|uniref:Caspase domain-containing protein n=1 Tax=Sulfitobacter sediminis TaxID=3234186 RepID=A0ABV3RS01_9RHOB
MRHTASKEQATFGRLMVMLGAIFLAFALLSPAKAQELEPRIALIVGNGAYGAVTPLDNTVPDAELMARTLEEQGFKVTMLIDANQIALNRAIAQFGRDLRDAGKEATGLFYYAGHAVQSFGSNYLLPTDASLTDAADLSLVAVPAQAVLRQMFSAKNKTNIVILDACRNNPFVSIPDLNDNGLAEMNAPTGTFLSYATAPGAVALDGLDGNSPFTKALAREIPKAGVPIEQLFKNVRVDVIEQTGGAQTPWDTSSLTNDFVFKPGEALTEAEIAELQLWDSVKDSTDPVPVVLFMRGYPDSKFIPEARALLEKIINSELGEQNAAAAVNAPQPEPPLAVAVPETPAAPEPQADTTQEQERLIGVAQASGAAEDYEAYLTAFPEGIYAEFAAFELKILKEKAERAAAAAQQAPAEPKAEEVVVAAAPSRAAAAPMGTELTWEMPFTSGGEGLLGKSISELVTLSPLFPPIEGLPEELWKDQSCSNCHQWTKEALCDQGKTYVNAGNNEAVSKQHPYGGGFKMNVRSWAEGGCK